jgi:nicotinamide mononucleotide transporter
MLDIIEYVAVIFAVAYLAFAIRQSLLCWPSALVSVSLLFVISYDARFYMQSALQVYYFAMAIYGWLQWKHGGEQHTGVRVHWWPPSAHVVAIASILVASGILGWILSGTDAAFPYLDSFATIAAILTTFMVARKVIENWLYWFVIDAVLVYMYAQGGRPLVAGLYALYLVMVVIGFLAWLKSSRSDLVGANDPKAT